MTRRTAISDRVPLLQRRALLQRGVRAFFDTRGYLEVETPYAVPTPGEEVHLRCFRTELERPDGTRETRFLHTSPEFAMKRIVAASGCRFTSSPVSGGMASRAPFMPLNSPCSNGIDPVLGWTP